MRRDVSRLFGERVCPTLLKLKGEMKIRFLTMLMLSAFRHKLIVIAILIVHFRPICCRPYDINKLAI